MYKIPHPPSSFHSTHALADPAKFVTKRERYREREREREMAATMAPWAKPGAWALDSEENEAELLQQQKDVKENGSHLQTEPLADFPSLAAAAATKPSKKKKAQTLSLSEFSTGVSVAPGSARSANPAAASKGLTPGEMLALPTGPRQRSAEELDRSRLGGGFRSYGSDNGSNSRWGSSRVSDESRKEGFGRESNRDLEPSRADEIDDWAAAKKSTVGNGGFERRERGPFFDSHSKADESDNWASNKSFVPSEGRRFGTSGGGGFDRDRRGGSDFLSREVVNGGRADSDTWGKKREEGSGTGGVGGRPRLNLQPRSLPVSNVQQQQDTVAVAKPKAANPFGEARPREEILAEKGQDWKKIDEQLESMKIKDGSSSEGPAFGRRGFGSGNERVRSPDDRTERGWRKMDSIDSRPSRFV